MESKIMKKYYEYMKDSGKLKVGVYEANQLATLCGINTATLVYLGSRANAARGPITLKDGWYIYALEERMVNKKPCYYITIDNSLKIS